MELKIEKTLLTRVQVSNAADTEAKYVVQANVSVSNGAVGNIESGVVKKDGTQKATFSRFSSSSKSVNFQCESTEEATILAQINEYVDALPALFAEE